MDSDDHSHGIYLETHENSFPKTNTSTKNTTTKDHDRVLPIANVGRIMKKVIPGNGKISKEAKETVQEYVSEFISFVTGEASDKCQREKRKTINGDDIIWAITILGFENYVNPLKVYLNRYREMEGDKLNNTPKQQQHQQETIICDTQIPMTSSQMPLQQLLHHHREQQRQQHYDQFLQIDQGLLPLDAASSVCSSNPNINSNDNNNNNNNNNNNTSCLTTQPQQHSFENAEEPFPYPSFSSTSVQKDFQHQEQIDSMLGQW